ARLAPRQALRAHARRGAAPEAQALRIHPRACVVDDATHGGARPQEPAPRHDGMDRLGPAAVCLRLSALGLRRSLPRLPGGAGARAAQADPRGQRAGGVPAAVAPLISRAYPYGNIRGTIMELREFEDEWGRRPFGSWFKALDAVAAARVQRALMRLE